MAAGAGQHDRPHLLRMARPAQRVERVRQLAVGLEGQRVAPLGAIEHLRLAAPHIPPGDS